MLGSSFMASCSPTRLLQKLAKLVSGVDGCCLKQEQDREGEDKGEGERSESSAPDVGENAAPGVVENVEKPTSTRRGSLDSSASLTSSTAGSAHNRSASWPMAAFKQPLEWGVRQLTAPGMEEEEEENSPRLHSLDTRSPPFEWGVVGQQQGSAMSFLVDSRQGREGPEGERLHTRTQSCPSLSRRNVSVEKGMNNLDTSED